MTNKQKIRIGVTGTGFIGKGFVHAVAKDTEFTVSKVVTRRSINECQEFPRPDLLTNSVNELLDNSDIILEATGDVLYVTEIVDLALAAKKPIVTMNTDFHVTVGSYFVDKGILTEAEGDEPGCIAALVEDIVAMGFKPVVFGNIKGFYNPNPEFKEMQYWSKKQGISLPMTISATDGTKIQFELALIANGLKAGIICEGLTGCKGDNFEELAFNLAKKSELMQQPISDYIMCPNTKAHIFIVAKHDAVHKEALRYFKMGEGPYYIFTKHWHLCYLETLKTIKRVIKQRKVLLNNSDKPTVSIAAIVKRDLKKGTEIKNGCGSFEVRGEAVRIVNHQGHIPIGLLANAKLKANVQQGQILNMDDVDIPESKALAAWQEIERRVFGKDWQK